jgi:hypothetical protein
MDKIFSTGSTIDTNGPLGITTAVKIRNNELATNVR